MEKIILRKYFKRIPTIETENLILRKIKIADYNDMFEYARLESVTKFLTWRAHADADYTRRYLQLVQDQYSDGEFYDWAVTLKESGKMIGTCGFTSFDENNNAGEVGYVINPVYAGRGYASEALREVINVGFMTLNLHRIYARCMDGNRASLRVMEKCGMTYEGCARSSMYIKGKYTSIHTSAIISDEFIRNLKK